MAEKTNKRNEMKQTKTKYEKRKIQYKAERTKISTACDPFYGQCTIFSSSPTVYEYFILFSFFFCYFYF